METSSTVDSSVENFSMQSETDTYSEKKSSTGSELSELAIDFLLWKLEQET